MLFGRKTVVVRTRPELDQAIANTQARQIVVDGDNELLSYAEQVVNPQSENISGGTWEFGAHRLVVSEENAAPLLSPLSDRAIGLASGGDLPAIIAVRRKVPISAVIIGALVSLLFLAGALFLWFLPASTPTAPAPILLPPRGLDFNGVAKVGWIIVALVAIIAAYRIVTKAIEGDRNVDLAWKITEKVSGRLVIKRVEVGRVTVRPNRKTKE